MARNLEHMSHMVQWLADHVAKNPHTLHGDYVIVHHYDDNRPDYPVVEAFHGPTGHKVGSTSFIPHHQYMQFGENGAPAEAPSWIDDGDGYGHYDAPPGLEYHPGGFWKKKLGHKVWMTEVDPKHRRKGIATAMYQHAGQHVPPILPGDVQTDDGAAFRASLKKKAAEDFPHPDGLARARSLAAPGTCVFCEEPVAAPRVACSNPDCQAAYYRAWHRDQAVRTPWRYGTGTRRIKPATAEEQAAASAARRAYVWNKHGPKVAKAEPPHHINSPEFKSWFGDSKAVTPDGKPMRLFHGTTAPENFHTFNIGSPRGVENEHGETEWEHGSGGDPSAYVGAHFAESPHVADKFTKPIYGRYRKEHGRVYPVHLRAVNPKHYESEDEFQRDLYQSHSSHIAVEDYMNTYWKEGEEATDEEFARYDKDPEFREKINRETMDFLAHNSSDGDEHLDFATDLGAEYRRKMQAQGYDSVRYRNDVEGGGHSWAVFEPHQIKSAIGSTGLYDPESDNITKSEHKDDPAFCQRCQRPHKEPTKHFKLCPRCEKDASTPRRPDPAALEDHLRWASGTLHSQMAKKSEGWLMLTKAEQTKFPFLIGADEAPRYQFRFKLDQPENLHQRSTGLNGYLEVRHGSEPVGVMSFDQEGASRPDSIHVGYLGVHPEHRGRGLGTIMLRRFRSWVNHHRPHIYFMQSEVTNQGAFKLLGRHLGDPLLLVDAVKPYTTQEAMHFLPKQVEEDGDKIPQGWNGIDAGKYLHAIHWIGPGQRPTTHPWVEAMQKNLKDEVRDRVLIKIGKLSKNLSRLPMPFARPRHNISWPLGALDWRSQKIKVQHRDGAGGQPTGAGWVQVQDGQVLSQDGHPVSARNPGAR